MRNRLLRALLLVAAVSLPARAGAVTPAAFEFRSGAIVDPARGLCYLMTEPPGIEALDLDSGLPRWSSTRPLKPLCLLGEVLAVQAPSAERVNVLQIEYLDTRRRGAHLGRTDIPLRAGVQARIEDGPGIAFRLRAWRAGPELVLSWTHTERALRAVPGGPVIAGRDWEAQGTAWVDWKTRKLLRQDFARALPPPAAEIPGPLARVRDAGGLPGPLWHSGRIFYAVARLDGREPRAELRRWRADTGQPLASLPLFEGPYTIRYPSADGRCLLVSRADPATQGEGARYQWLIFALATGTRIARTTQQVPAAWFFLHDSLLVYEAPSQIRVVEGSQQFETRRICAVDLASNTNRWCRPMHDVSYRGSFPPGKSSKTVSSAPPMQLPSPDSPSTR